MIDYEDMILARQEMYDSDYEDDCQHCPYLEHCRMDEENKADHTCYLNLSYE